MPLIQPITGATWWKGLPTLPGGPVTSVAGPVALSIRIARRIVYEKRDWGGSGLALRELYVYGFLWATDPDLPETLMSETLPWVRPITHYHTLRIKYVESGQKKIMTLNPVAWFSPQRRAGLLWKSLPVPADGRITYQAVPFYLMLSEITTPLSSIVNIVDEP